MEGPAQASHWFGPHALALSAVVSGSSPGYVAPIPRRAIFVLLAVGLLAAACGDDGGDRSATTDRPDPAADQVDTYVGTLDGTDAYLAVAVAKSGATAAYLCDGTPERAASVSAQLTGRLHDGVLELKSGPRVAIAGELEYETLSGTVAIDGDDYTYTVQLADKPAGLYQSVKNVDGEDQRARWVVLPDGSYRGAFFPGGPIAVGPLPGGFCGGVGCNYASRFIYYIRW